MADKDTTGVTGLAKIWGWVEKPGSMTVLITTLVIACAVSVGWDFTYEKYGYFMEETLIGAYAAFGLIAFLTVIVTAKGWRELIGRAEDYYGERSVDGEAVSEETDA